MPSISSMILPQTNNPDEFEEMVKSYCSSNYRKIFSKVGRKGQKQYGLDLISDYNGVNNCGQKVIDAALPLLYNGNI